MRTQTHVLSINGSDSTGLSGIQADVHTANALGVSALTAVTSLTVQSTQGIAHIKEMPTALVVGQIRSVYEEFRPKAVKVGMLGSVDTIRQVREEISCCPNIVASPVILSSDGTRLMDDEAVLAFRRYLLPVSKLLILKAQDAELLLHCTIQTDEQMLSSAKRLCQEGAEWVMLRGSRHVDGRVTALLYGRQQRFFSSYNIEGWRRHGVGGTLSMAVAVRLSKGDDVPEAIAYAHDYLHSQVVYALESADGLHLRPREIYNHFISLIAQHHKQQHEVRFYAKALAITPRYLSQVTHKTIGKTPKQVLDEYLLAACKQRLTSTTLSVQEIAQDLGFATQSHFTRFLKSKDGRTPNELRKNV